MSRASRAVHLLFLGYSSIVRRRVLPAARTVSAIHGISVASRSHGRDGAAGRVDGDGAVDGWYADYEEALASAGTDLVLRLGDQRGPRGVGDACSPPRLPRHRRQAHVPGPGDRRGGGAPRTGAGPRPGRGNSFPVSPAGGDAARARRSGGVECHPRHCHVLVSAAAAGRLPLPRRLRRRELVRPRDPTPRRRTGCCSAPRRTACTAPSSRGMPRGTAASTRRSACC